METASKKTAQPAGALASTKKIVNQKLPHALKPVNRAAWQVTGSVQPNPTPYVISIMEKSCRVSAAQAGAIRFGLGRVRSNAMVVAGQRSFPKAGNASPYPLANFYRARRLKCMRIKAARC